MRSRLFLPWVKNKLSRRPELTHEEKLAKLKLDLFKQYLTENNNSLNVDRKKLIADARSIGEVWKRLIASEL